MAEMPMPYSPEADVPLAEVPQVTDLRVQQVAAQGEIFKQIIRDVLPGSPYVEQAVRYVDLAVQAGHQAAQDRPPGPVEQP